MYDQSFRKACARAAMRLLSTSVAVVALTSAAVHGAEKLYLPTLSTYGTTGLIDMPTAEMQPDGELTTTISNFKGGMRNTIGFQITPRLSGSFRYTFIQNFRAPTATNDGSTYDRSFDFSYKVIDNSRYFPDVALGLRDMIGTALYSAEYIVATQRITPQIALSGGIGWGRLGSHNSSSNPLSIVSDKFSSRPTEVAATGGTANINHWFRGPAAPFAGVSWDVNEDLTLKAEYSSDAYPRATQVRNTFVRDTAVNLGVVYQFDENISFGANYLHGTELGVQMAVALNPLKSPYGGHAGTAPLPMTQRPDPQVAPASWSTRWTAVPENLDQIKEDVRIRLADEGQLLESLTLTANRAVLYLRNQRYDAESQAIGRAARVLAAALPASVETFVIVPVVKGMPAVAVTLQRSDLETLEYEFDGAEQLFARAEIADPLTLSADEANTTEIYPRSKWSLDPSFAASLFDPDEPLRAGLGLRLSGSFEVTEGLLLSGAVRKSLFGNLDTVTRPPASVLPNVRSNYGRYAREGDPSVLRLTLEKFDRPFKDIYTRASVGYFETMFGGVSSEILWKQPNNPLALGFELNYVQQRDFDGLLGFRDYDIVTGHASAYYNFDNGFRAQVDVGQYLAGDVGATFGLKRTFENGWQIGGFFTLTDVPFSEFGEGSFDKGLSFTVPLGWLTGQSTRRDASVNIRPLTRDGGARLNVENRLYDLVEEYHTDPLSDTWGRIWR